RTMIPTDLFDCESLDKTLGIEYVELEAERVVATMPVGPRVHQPLGYLHGGASVALAEPVASVGANMTALAEGQAAAGLAISGNRGRRVRGGLLRAVGAPLHRGRTAQVWGVRSFDAGGRRVCVSRCTVALVAQDG